MRALITGAGGFAGRHLAAHCRASGDEVVEVSRTTGVDLLDAEAARGAVAQATWRHLLFGSVLGELERRLNPPEAEPEPIDAAAAASNGHGSVEHLVATGP